MATEKRLIDLDATFKRLEKEVWWTESQKSAIRQFLNKDKRVDAVEVVHGRWEDIFQGRYENPRFRCSVCKEKALYVATQTALGNWRDEQDLSNYCPNCGAKMDGDGNG